MPITQLLVNFKIVVIFYVYTNKYCVCISQPDISYSSIVDPHRCPKTIKNTLMSRTVALGKYRPTLTSSIDSETVSDPNLRL